MNGTKQIIRLSSILGLTLALILSLATTSIAKSDDAMITSEFASHIQEDGYYKQLLQREQELQYMLNFISEAVPLKEKVTVIIGADDGPLYDPNTNEIWIPTEFLQEIDQRFVDAELKEEEEERNDAVLDVLLHTLIHEIGHAVIAQYEVPTLGKEEDAADNLANVLILEYLEEGDLIALNAADMFALEDRDIESFNDENFWDEHSLDIQRYYTTVCHVYGAYPDTQEELVQTGELSEEKAEQCIDEYELISHDWLSVLESLKP